MQKPKELLPLLSAIRYDQRLAAASDILLALVSGGIGGTSALAGQFIAQRAARRRHIQELEQRNKELSASFALPLAARRAEAFEELFDLLQKAMDERIMSLGDYERVRRLLIYVPSPLAQPVVTNLTGVLRGHRTQAEADTDEAIANLRALQADIRAAGGVLEVERYLGTDQADRAITRRHRGE
jgi:hypothetical protein